MKFIIKHDIRGRLRIHMVQSRMSYEEADTLLYYIENLSGVTSAKVFERTCDASISYKGDRETPCAFRKRIEQHLSGETGAEGRTPGRKQTVSAISDPRRLCRF